MNFERFLQAYRSTVQRVASLLPAWAELDDDQREFLAESLQLVLVRRGEALGAVTKESDSFALMSRLVPYDNVLRLWAAAIWETMDLKVEVFLAPPALSAHGMTVNAMPLTGQGVLPPLPAAA